MEPRSSAAVRPTDRWTTRSPASSREDANELADAIDELAHDGSVTVRELAVAHKNSHGRTKVHYITDHGTGMGAGIGHAFDLHHEGAKDVLKQLSEHVDNGEAVTFAVVDLANAKALPAAFPDREAHMATVTGEEQEAITAELSDEG